jgi:flavin-dependent dehydrogenase
VYNAAVKTAPDLWISFHKVTGEKVAGPQAFSLHKDGVVALNEDGKLAPDRVYRVLRPKFNAALLVQVLALGIEVKYGQRAVDYFEDDRKSGVILEDGSKVEVDVVIAADGLGTKSYKLINGHDIRAMSSKYSIFRTAYYAENIMSDPELDKMFLLRDEGGAVM